MQKTYEYAMVLCAESRNSDGTFPEFDGNGYLGGQLRADAALALFQQGGAETLIIVGGNTKSQELKSFLVEQSVPSESITCVVSGPNTLGNIRALYLTYADELAGKEVAVLTNAYHLPRTMRFIADKQFSWQNTSFTPVAAESIVTRPPAYASDPQSLQQRLAIETQGLQDIENGTYAGQNLPKSAWTGEKLS